MYVLLNSLFIEVCSENTQIRKKTITKIAKLEEIDKEIQNLGSLIKWFSLRMTVKNQGYN